MKTDQKTVTSIPNSFKVIYFVAGTLIAGQLFFFVVCLFIKFEGALKKRMVTDIFSLIPNNG